jgi:hypothetical protein
MPIEEHSLYLASWEHFHLLDNDTPTGLPNQLFSDHPWLLILFEHIYCDVNGFQGEKNAADTMAWVNSQLFVKLASRECGEILRPVHVQSFIQPHAKDMNDRFALQHGMSLREAVASDSVTVEELFDWRLQGLAPFLEQHELVLYDWPVARHDRELPLSVRLTAKEVLGFEVAAVPLAKDFASELPPERKALFDDLQRFESEPLRQLRSGRLTQHEYLDILTKRIRDYREIDMVLIDQTPQRLQRILTLRERFGKRGGWVSFRRFLAAYRRAAPPQELNDLERELRTKLEYCFLPLMKEYGPALVRILGGMARLNPIVHHAEIADEVVSGIRRGEGPMRELINFLRGQSRRQIGRNEEHGDR